MQQVEIPVASFRRLHYNRLTGSDESATKQELQMKQLSFCTIGYSTEDQAVFNEKGVDFYEHLKKDGFEGCFQDSICTDTNVATVDKLVESAYEWNEDYKTDAEFAKAVAELKEFMYNKVGVLATWGVEYDYNLVFVENVTVDELKELVANWEISDEE